MNKDDYNKAKPLFSELKFVSGDIEFIKEHKGSSASWLAAVSQVNHDKDHQLEQLMLKFKKDYLGLMVKIKLRIEEEINEI